MACHDYSLCDVFGFCFFLLPTLVKGGDDGVLLTVLERLRAEAGALRAGDGVYAGDAYSAARLPRVLEGVDVSAKNACSGSMFVCVNVCSTLPVNASEISV